jgi:hypothetical protein
MTLYGENVLIAGNFSGPTSMQKNLVLVKGAGANAGQVIQWYNSPSLNCCRGPRASSDASDQLPVTHGHKVSERFVDGYDPDHAPKPEGFLRTTSEIYARSIARTPSLQFRKGAFS